MPPDPFNPEFIGELLITALRFLAAAVLVGLGAEFLIFAFN